MLTEHIKNQQTTSNLQEQVKVASLVRALNCKSHKHLDSYDEKKFLQTFCSASSEHPQDSLIQNVKDASYRVKLKKTPVFSKTTHRKIELSRKPEKIINANLSGTTSQQSKIVALNLGQPVCQQGVEVARQNSIYDKGTPPAESKAFSRMSSANGMERSLIGGVYVINPVTLSNSNL